MLTGRSCIIDSNYIFRGYSLYSIDGQLLKEFGQDYFDVAYTYCYYFSGLLVLFTTTAMTTFSFNSENLEFTLQSITSMTFNPVGVSYGDNLLRQPKYQNNSIIFTEGANYGITHLGIAEGEKTIRTLTRKTTVLYNPIDAKAVNSDVLIGKTYYNKYGKSIGMMPNNGELNYTSSEEEQIIPSGYTSGGVIAAADITKLSDYATCNNLAEMIAGELDYLELNYIESNGTQYINTGIKASSNIKIEADIELVQANNDTALFGARYSPPNRLALYTYKNNEVYYYFGSSGYPYYQEANLLSRKLYTVDKNILTVDGVTKITATDTTFSSDDDIYIFAGNSDTGAAVFAYEKLYSFKIWENNILVRHFIPVLEISTGNICLYDKVEGIFYYNQGTGDFANGGIVGASTELEAKLRLILEDKNTNLLPENLKTGITCLGVEGTLNTLTDIDGSIEDEFVTLSARSIVNGKISINPDMFVTVRYNNSSEGLNNLGFKRFCFIKTSSVELPLYVDSSDNNIDYVSLWIHSDGTVEPYSSTPTSGSMDNSAVFKKFNGMPDVANTLEEKTNLQTITSLTDEVFDITTLNLANENGWICSGVKLIEDYDPDAAERLYTNPDSVPSQVTSEVIVRNIFGKEQPGEIIDYGDDLNFELNNAGDIGEVTYNYKPFDYDVLGFEYKFRKNAGVIRPGLPLDLYVNFSTIVEAGGITADKIVSGNTILGVEGTAEVGVDTSDATVTSNDMVQGKTAYANGEKIIGAVAEINAPDGMPGSYNLTNYNNTLLVQAIATYDALIRTGAKINAEIPYDIIADYIGLTADKIKAGETILGITGTYTGEITE